MERPIAIAAQTFDPQAACSPHAGRRDGSLTAATGARACTHAFAALIAFGLLGCATALVAGFAGDLPAEVRAQWAEALAILCGAVGAFAVAVHQLRLTAPTALRDRSARGCAWFGAPDAVITHAFLLGGALAFAQVVALPTPSALVIETSTPPFADWQLLPAMVFAFAVIAVAPVCEELLMRGLLFATLRTRWSTPTAALLVTAVFALLHSPQILRYPPALVGTLAVGALALNSRLRHASLAPPIALHCGHNFTVCVVAALG
jgi:membrane protease YdiL (CAAX protease family)